MATRTDDDESQSDRRKGPSTQSLTFGGIIAIASLLASGVATYNAVMNDIATLKRGEVYQERVNENMREENRTLRQEIKDMRMEQREIMTQFGNKIDRLIEVWPARRRD